MLISGADNLRRYVDGIRKLLRKHETN